MRQAKAKECPVCHGEFVPRRIGQKVCSRSCSGKLVAASGAGARAYGQKVRAEKPMVTKTCPVCSAKFDVHPAYALRRKTCSVECAARIKRRAAGRKGRKNPNYRNGNAVGRRATAAWRDALQRKCENCGRTHNLHLHHVVYRQAVRREGGDVWDPQNAMTLCATCHAQHHAASRRIPLSKVPESALAFARALMGPAAAHYYFRRYYGPAA